MTQKLSISAALLASSFTLTACDPQMFNALFGGGSFEGTGETVFVDGVQYSVWKKTPAPTSFALNNGIRRETIYYVLVDGEYYKCPGEPPTCSEVARKAANGEISAIPEPFSEGDGNSGGGYDGAGGGF